MPSKDTRPTTDRVREAWASTLMSLTPSGSFEDARILDCFAGSGALGLELLSRGGESCLFMERNRVAFSTLRSNISSLGLAANRAKVCNADSFSEKALSCAADSGPFDFVILDPPYVYAAEHIAGLLVSLEQRKLLHEHCVISYEHSAGFPKNGDCLFPQNSEHDELSRKRTFALIKQKKYGTTSIDYYVYE